MLYCLVCGGSTEPQETRGGRLRPVCARCGAVAYSYPKIVVGTIPVQDGRVYLIRRGIEPRRGTWSNPAGFLELGETVEEGALRETEEETGFEVEIERLLSVYSRSRFGVVVIVFLARIVGGAPRLCHETLEIRDFGPDEVPWTELAFPTTEWAIADWARLALGREPTGLP